MFICYICHLHMLHMSSSDTGVLPVLEIVTWVSRPRLSPVFLWQLVSSICQFQSLYKGRSGPYSGPFSRLKLIWRVDGSLTDWSGPSLHYFLLSLCQRTMKNCPVEICHQISLWVSRTHKCFIQPFYQSGELKTAAIQMATILRIHKWEWLAPYPREDTDCSQSVCSKMINYFL